MADAAPSRPDIERQMEELRRTVETQRQQLDAMRKVVDALQEKVLKDAGGRNPPKPS